MGGPSLRCIAVGAQMQQFSVQYGFSGPEFNAQAELVEAHSPFDKLRANGKSSK
jgi:hypothetical protein